MFSILRLPAVKSCTGLSRSTIYKLVSEKKFPAPVSLGARAVGWYEHQVQDWLKQRQDIKRRPHVVNSERKAVGGAR